MALGRETSFRRFGGERGAWSPPRVARDLSLSAGWNFQVERLIYPSGRRKSKQVRGGSSDPGRWDCRAYVKSKAAARESPAAACACVVSRQLIRIDAGIAPGFGARPAGGLYGTKRVRVGSADVALASRIVPATLILAGRVLGGRLLERRPDLCRLPYSRCPPRRGVRVFDLTRRHLHPVVAAEYSIFEQRFGDKCE